jgi:hypothetical protein
MGSGLPRVPNLVHSEKSSPSAMLPLGNDLTLSAPSPVFVKKLFHECNTQERNFFFFETASPSATFGEEICFLENLFPECRSTGTRGRIFFFLNTLPRVSRTEHSGKSFFLLYRVLNKPQIDFNISQITFINDERPNISRIHNILQTTHPKVHIIPSSQVQYIKTSPRAAHNN